MKIKPEVSSVVDTLVTPSGNQIPIIDTSMAETTVMVKDNATIIIGGLRRDDEVLVSKKIPFLGSIPIIGKLMSSETKTKQRSELLVMLTPHIIEGDVLETGEQTPKDAPKSYRDYGVVDPDQEEKGSETFEEKQELGKLELKPYRN